MDIETLQTKPSHTPSAHAGYLVHAQNSHTGVLVRENHATMKAAVAHSVVLLRAGYSVGIWSAASLENY
jgi:hypothetical protein